MVLPLELGIAGREILSFARQATLLRHDLGAVLPRAARPGDDVVVCLHGLFATAGVLRPLRKRLERHRGVHTATMTYPAGPGIEELSRRLGRLVEALPEGVRLHLVGHSLGGVVARHFALRHGEVVQTISLASPFAGVEGVAWLRLGVARDLAPDSALLRRLRLARSSIPHLSLLAESDGVVRAPLSHALPGGELQVIPRCGHNTMLYHPEVSDRVERRILAHR